MTIEERFERVRFQEHRHCRAVCAVGRMLMILWEGEHRA